jgi:hypothetical protein
MAHMITLDEEYLEKGLIRTCIRTGVQQTREKNVPGRAKFGDCGRAKKD